MVLLAPVVVAAALFQVQTGASRLMLATVTDPRGRTIVDLGPDDFVVQEAAATREILSVRIADYPIVVLLDATATPEDFALMQRAAVHFIERLGNDRAVIAGTLGRAPALLTSFEDDRQRVLDRIGGVQPPLTAPGGGSDAAGTGSTANRALAGAAMAARALHATGSLFSSIVILSASPDEAGETNPALVAPIVESGTIVHVIALEPAVTGDRVAPALRTIVGQTRGELTPIYAAASYQAALDRLTDRLGSEILIEYLVPPGSKPADAKVGIRVPGARVRGLGVAPK